MSIQASRQTLAILSLALPFPLLAQTGPVQEFNNIVVTASRLAQLEQDVIGDVSVIRRKELQQAGQNSLVEVLARQPGVQFHSNGGPQATTGVFLRGAAPAQTLVLIDGMRINGSMQSSVHWNAIDPAVLERVEIVRGAASSIYGSDAMGGVINIITKRTGQDRPLSAWGNIGLGTHDTFKSSAGISGATNGWDYAASGSFAASGGYNATNPNIGAFNFHPDKDGYSQHAFSGSLGYTWQPGQHIGLTAYDSYLNSDFDAGEFLNPAVTKIREQAYTITSTNDITASWKSTLRAGLSKEHIETRVYGGDYGTLQRSYTWQNDFTLTPEHRLTTILERLEERPFYHEEIAENRRNTNALGLIYRGDIGIHHVQASVRNDSITGYGSRTTGSLGYEIDIASNWRAGIAANTAFRAPAFIDLYSPYAPNPDLKPEKSRNIEASLRYTTQTVRLGLVAFQNKFDDMITLDPTRDWTAYNIDKATIRGASITAEYDFGDTTLRAGADFLRPRNDTTGKTLQLRAKQIYRLSLDHRVGNWVLGTDYLFTGNRYNDADNTNRLGGYGLLSLNASYDFTRQVGVQIRWNNVLNKYYAPSYGYEPAGSNVFVNLSWRM